MLSFLSRFLFGSPEKPEEKWQSHDNPPQKFEIQNYPIMASGGDVGSNSGEANYEYGYPIQGYNLPSAQHPPINHRPQNTYTQIGGGQNNPQIQGVGKIANKGDLNMGYSSGATNNFNNQGSYAEKQIQGVNGGSVQM